MFFKKGWPKQGFAGIMNGLFNLEGQIEEGMKQDQARFVWEKRQLSVQMQTPGH